MNGLGGQGYIELIATDGVYYDQLNDEIKIVNQFYHKDEGSWIFLGFL